MALIGLWHGFSWLYLAWGIYHGTIIALENLLNRTTVNKKEGVQAVFFYFRCFLTQAVVTLAIIVYSPNHEAVIRIYKGLLNLPSF